jgi:hypothetical protein
VLLLTEKMAASENKLERLPNWIIVKFARLKLLSFDFIAYQLVSNQNPKFSDSSGNKPFASRKV